MKLRSRPMLRVSRETRRLRRWHARYNAFHVEQGQQAGRGAGATWPAGATMCKSSMAGNYSSGLSTSPLSSFG